MNMNKKNKSIIAVYGILAFIYRGCIVNRVNGNNLQYKIKGDNKS